MPYSQQVANTNYLAPTGFKILISRENAPNMQYFAQNIMHPSMDIDTIDFSYKRLSNLPLVGDKISMGALVIDFILDEDLKAYEDIFDWLQRIVQQPVNTGGARFENSGTTSLSTFADLTVTILTSKNNSNRQIRYKNAFPTSLGDIQFASSSDGTYINVPVTFRFDYFELI